MKLLDLFNECIRGDYNETKTYVSWKIVDGVMYFQPSKEVDDWLKNFFVLPVLTRIGGKWMIVPIGFYLAWKEVRKIVRENPVTMYVGYSHGAVLAAFSSVDMQVKAITFGTPNYLLRPSIKTFSLFGLVTSYQNPGDIVTAVPPVYQKGGRTVVLTKDATRPRGCEFVEEVEWETGHTPAEYRQRLEGMEI